MKIRTHSLVAAAALALLSLPALSAQNTGVTGARGSGDRHEGRDRSDRSDRSHGRHARMAEYLDLTEEQQASARQLFEGLREKTRPIREEQRATHEKLRAALDAPNPDPTAIGRLMLSIHANRQEVKAAREQVDASFAALLTPEQRQKYESLKESREVFGRGAEGRHGRHGHRGLRGGRR